MSPIADNVAMSAIADKFRSRPSGRCRLDAPSRLSASLRRLTLRCCVCKAALRHPNRRSATQRVLVPLVSRHSSAKLAATETPAVRKRVAALDGVLAVAHQLASERRLLRDVQATRQRTISGSKQAEKDFRAAEKRERDCSEALRVATERVSQIGYDPERAERNLSTRMRQRVREFYE